MKTLIVYDSVYGNTEKIAKAIGEGVAGEVMVLCAGEVDLSKMEAFDLVIAGSPTHGGRPTPAMRDFLNGAPGPALKDTKVAAFDTRVTNKFVSIFGYAAGRIGNSLKSKGGRLVVSPEGFYVKGSQGPLKEGELERATGWGKGIIDGLK
ncbi:MAG: flavodoxin family protein [Candidatus Bathyarchaeota archaeon]